MPKKQPKSEPKAPKAAKVQRDKPTNGSAAVYRVTVPEADAAHLQSAYGFRVTSRNADGTYTMSATSGAYALYRAGR